MTITVNIGQSLIDITTSDTVIINPVGPVIREGIQGASIHNTTGAPIDVELYESPNLTSASGSLVAEYPVSANSSQDVGEIIGQGYEVGQNIIAVAASAGLNIKITKTVTE
jgi:hypothetical protein